MIVDIDIDEQGQFDDEWIYYRLKSIPTRTEQARVLNGQRKDSLTAQLFSATPDGSSSTHPAAFCPLDDPALKINGAQVNSGDHCQLKAKAC